MNVLNVPLLEGTRVLLEPLAVAHVPGLVRAASGDRRSFVFTDVPKDEPSMQRYVDIALRNQREGTVVPFAITERATGGIVGSTRFGNIEFWPWPEEDPHQRGADVPDAVEIGWTWLSGDAQRTGINREAKLLMLTHAFESWHVHRVTLKTDARNEQSVRAIMAIGAKSDGVLRAAHIAYDGGIRDSAMFSILDSEWEEIKTRLLRLLAR